MKVSSAVLDRQELGCKPYVRWVQSLVVGGLRTYQWVVSPLLGPACRFHPTCSDYAIEAVSRHGLLYGAWLTMWRLMRCHPFGRHGCDPVP